MSAALKMGNGLSPLRVGRITGSRIGAILGLNPYQSRADVLRQMVREALGAESEFTGNDATRYGQAKEPEALALYEGERGVMTYGGDECIVHPEHDFLAVTPDGLVDPGGMIECKAPYSASYTHWSERPYYEAQMRLQLECCGRGWCDFVVLDRDGKIHTSRLERDPEWLPSVLPTLQEFMTDYAAALESPDEYLADKVADMERHMEWRALAADYAAAKGAADEAKARMDEAKAALVKLAEASGSKCAKGAGLQVIRSERAGSVAYAKAIKDMAPDADLSAYTGKPTVIYTVREAS